MPDTGADAAHLSGVALTGRPARAQPSGRADACSQALGGESGGRGRGGTLGR